MNDAHDPLMERLARLDPAGSDTPPAVGSSRYETILEHAMQTIDTPAPTITPNPGPTATVPVVVDQQGRRSRRPSWFLGAAAAATLVVAGAVVLRPGAEPDARAAILEAAEGTADLGSFRVALTVDEIDPAVSDHRATADVVGADIAVVQVIEAPDGDVSEGFTVIGDTIYQTIDGVTSSAPVGDSERLADFGESSAAVVRAASVSADIALVGEEDLGSGTTSHYRIVLDDAGVAALTALTPGELAWFELEYPYEVDVIDVWVSDDVIHKIQVTSERAVTETVFTDFGADITIAPPQ